MGAACTPAIVARADDQRYLLGLVIDHGSLYFSAGGGAASPPTGDAGADTLGVVRRLDLSSGAIEQLWSGVAVPYRLATNPTNVYFETSQNGSLVRGGILQRLTKDGNQQATLASWRDEGGCMALAAAPEGAYWTATNGGAGDLSLTASDGGTTVLSSDLMCDGLVALLGDTVYVTAGTKIVAVPRNGGATTVVWDSGGVELGAFAASTRPRALFVATRQQVMRVDPATAEAAVVLDGRSFVVALATDGTAVYVSDQGAGVIVEVPLAGGPPSVLASGQPVPASLALDDHDVYWVEGQSRTVRRCPKGL
ncbi:MAG TPA: hypothetical protein VKZ18_04000 [Polyangia bacterium]|nr:hypothetical protein [Polyangia bacterium]